jgi:ATP-dependent HslUV protease subunit HslV
LEAVLIVGNPQHLYLISGNGEIIEPDDGILGIGSGGNYALAAARALVRNTSLSAFEIVKQSLLIASEICIYSNSNIVIQEIKQ